jgi:signal transduction histidine kinase
MKRLIEFLDSVTRRLSGVRRLGIFAGLAALGVIATLVIWWSAVQDSSRRSSAILGDVAREVHGVLNARVERHVESLRNLALLWQLHGLGQPEAWDFNNEMMIRTFSGLEWIAWVNAETGAYRFAARDSSARMDSRIVDMARERATAPASQSIAGMNPQDPVLLFTPVRTSQDSVGMLVASISPERLLGHEFLVTGDIIAYTVTTEAEATVYRWGQPASNSPPTMAYEMSLPPLFGTMWTVRYQPTPIFMKGVASRWHSSFLLTGLLLSLALGAIAYQFVTLREYSIALAATNQRLDAQVRELSERDQALRQMNDELEQRVEARTNQLAEAMKELETFSHSMSHDLRSPIGAILNFSSILEEDYGAKLGPEGTRVLHRIRDSGNSATRLLDQLVQFVWLGREAAETNQVDMTRLAREAFKEVSVGPGADQVTFDLQDLPSVRGNSALLGRVFRNLLSNAVKYTRGQSGSRITVRAKEGTTETAYWVEDNGIGFDPAQARSLFEPFRRLHSSSEYEGVGLGLAIVAKIVRRHGGRVWAESNGSGGAQFGFALPREGETA